MQCDAKELRAAVTAAKRATGRRSAVRILQGVRLDPGAGGLEVSATDLEVRSSVQVSATGNGLAGSIVDVAHLAGALQGAKGVVTLEGGGASPVVLELESGARQNLEVMPAADYPFVPAPDWHAAGLVVDAAELARAAVIVRASASRDESRPVLTGVRLEVKRTESAGGVLELASTDSYRLHVLEMPAAIAGEGVLEPAGQSGEPEELAGRAIVPSRALELAGRFLAKSSPGGPVARITWHRPPAGNGGALWCFIGTADRYAAARCIDGQFPNVGQLMPSVGAWDWCTLEPAAVLPVLKSAERFLSGSRSNLPVVLEWTTGRRLIVSASVADAGTFGPVDLEYGGVVAGERGEGVRIGFNAGFLADALEHVGQGETVRVNLRTALRPAVLEGAGGRALVMPIRLAG